MDRHFEEALREEGIDTKGRFRPWKEERQMENEKKIVVPDFMLSVAYEWARTHNAFGMVKIAGVLEAALRALMDKPMVPTSVQMRHIEITAAHEPLGSTRGLSDMLTEWQRIMFLAPDTNNAIEDLVEHSYQGLAHMTIGEALDKWPDRIRKVAIEAYRRGKESK